MNSTQSPGGSVSGSTVHPADRSRWSRADGERLLQAETPRVLLAEDDSDMRRLVARALRRQGYDVVELRDGQDLLGYLRSSMLRPGQFPPPDLVVSDVRMPRVTGL